MTPTTLDLKLCVLFLREGETWIAQCLQYDIAAQGRTLSEALTAFGQTVSGQICVDLHHKVEPLSGFAQAPREYWARFEKSNRLADSQPIYIPETSMPPAYMIHAMAADMRVGA